MACRCEGELIAMIFCHATLNANIAMQAFTPEQLEDLEGVLWKSYFA